MQEILSLKCSFFSQNNAFCAPDTAYNDAAGPCRTLTNRDTSMQRTRWLMSEVLHKHNQIHEHAQGQGEKKRAPAVSQSLSGQPLKVPSLPAAETALAAGQ